MASNLSRAMNQIHAPEGSLMKVVVLVINDELAIFATRASDNLACQGRIFRPLAATTVQWWAPT